MIDIGLLSLLIKFKAQFGNAFFVETVDNVFIARPPTVTEIENWQDTVSKLELNNAAAMILMGRVCLEDIYEKHNGDYGIEYRKVDKNISDDVALDLGASILESTPITQEELTKSLNETKSFSAPAMVAYDIATLMSQPVEDLKQMTPQNLLKLYQFILLMSNTPDIFQRLGMAKKQEPQKVESSVDAEELAKNFDKLQEEFAKFLEGGDDDGNQ